MSAYKLRFGGETSIVPRMTVSAGYYWAILIMGPTGAGKSAFIEALAGEGHSLGILKDQLAGFTQDILFYEVRNAYAIRRDGPPHRVYLVDTPGFADSKISEMEIISKVKGWMKDNRILSFRNMLYFTPITDTRVPGSKQQTITMLRSLLLHDSSPNLTIMTTMWDNVSNPKAKERAEANYSQLRADFWKHFVDNGAHLARFENNHSSAMAILRKAVRRRTRVHPLDNRPISIQDPSTPLLYQDLLSRINSARQEIKSFRIMIGQVPPITIPDPLLESAVVPLIQDIKQDLAKFLDQMVEFGAPPPEFEHVPAEVVSQHVLNYLEEAQAEKHAVELALARLGTDNRQQRETFKSSIKKAQLKITKASQYIDESGSPVPLLSDSDMKKVLEALHPRPRISLMNRVKDEAGALKKKSMWVQDFLRHNFITE